MYSEFMCDSKWRVDGEWSIQTVSQWELNFLISNTGSWNTQFVSFHCPLVTQYYPSSKSEKVAKII